MEVENVDIAFVTFIACYRNDKYDYEIVFNLIWFFFIKKIRKYLDS